MIVMKSRFLQYIQCEDNELEVEIADGVKVRVVQSTVTQVLSKTEPATS